MTKVQARLRELRDRQSKQRQRMAELAVADSLTDETRSELDELESGVPDLERQLRAAQGAADEEEREQRSEAESRNSEDPETRELRELQTKSRVADFVVAAVEQRAVDGASREFSQAVGAKGRFPLQLLAPAYVEKRASTDADVAANQQEWLDRLFYDTAAMHLGVTMRSAAPGVASVPVTTAGATAAQRGRSEAAADAAWTVGTTEIKPTRNAVRAVFSTEDAARIPGLEDALRRDLAAALMEGIDRAIFIGDDGANENVADIVGFQTAAVTETTITQVNKLKPSETLAMFAAMIDGQHASSTDDLNVVSSVGTNTLWMTTIANAAAENQTLAQFLMASGLSWRARGGIDTNTAAGDFGAFVGLNRGISGAAVSAIWQAADLIRDPYTGAAKGEVGVTLSYQWGFKIPRTSNFRRIKFVA